MSEVQLKRVGGLYDADLRCDQPRVMVSRGLRTVKALSAGPSPDLHMCIRLQCDHPPSLIICHTSSRIAGENAVGWFVFHVHHLLLMI